jgi:hypothetical protein
LDLFDREGVFKRVMSLDVHAICGSNLKFTTTTIPMNNPEYAGNVRIVELAADVKIASEILSVWCCHKKCILR